MTDPTRESEQISGEPTANGPATDAEPAALPAPPPAPGGEFPPLPKESDEPPAVPAILDKIRRRTARTQVRPEDDRIQTLEERLIRLEALLTQKLAVETAERAPDPPVASAAPPTAEVAPPVPNAPVATVVDPPLAAVAPPADPARSLGRWRWLVLPVLFQTLSQAFNNFRLFLRMYVDPRYRMTWLGRLVPLAFLLFLVFSDWQWRVFEIIFFWNLIPIFGPIINKLVLLLFAWITIKVLSREMRRYQETVPDVPEALRWNNR